MMGSGRTALAVVLAGLASTLAFELSRGGEALVPAASPGRPQQASPAAASAVPAETHEQAMAALLARPLFTPGRRPHAGAAVAQQAAPAPTLPRVAGIVVVGGSRHVIFAGTGPGRPLVLAEGGNVNGFRVQSIEPGRITVAGPDGTRTLLPSFDSQSSAAPEAAPALPQALPVAALPAILPSPDLVPGAAPLPDRLPPPPAQVVGLPSSGALANGLQIPGLPLALPAR